MELDSSGNRGQRSVSVPHQGGDNEAPNQHRADQYLKKNIPGQVNQGQVAIQAAEAISLRSNLSSGNRRRVLLSQPLTPFGYQPPKTPKSRWSKFKDGFRAFVAWVFSNVGICVLVVGYLLMGAVTFQQLEGPEEELIVYHHVSVYRNQTVQKLWEITEKWNTLHPMNWSHEVADIMREYQARIITEAASGFDGMDIPNRQWTFSGALLYSITVITTIGKYDKIL